MSIEPAKETVLFGFDDRQVQVSQEAYSIFMAREHELRQQLADVSNERDGLRAKLECSQGDMRQADQVMERQRTQISDLEQSLEDSLKILIPMHWRRRCVRSSQRCAAGQSTGLKLSQSRQ